MPEVLVKFLDFFSAQTAHPSTLEERFFQGEMAALETVMLSYQKGIYHLGLRLFASPEKAADFFQDVFLKISDKHRQYNPTRPLKPWIYRVAMNLGRDMLRRKAELAVGDENLPEPSQEPLAEKKLLADEQKTLIWKVVAQLHPSYREIIALRFSSDLSLAEIAIALGISLTAAKVRLCRGLRAFEAVFKAQGGEAYVL